MELGQIGADADCQGAEGAEQGGLARAGIAILLRVATSSEAADEGRNRRNSRFSDSQFPVRNSSSEKPTVSFFTRVPSSSQELPKRGRKSHSKFSLGEQRRRRRPSERPASHLPPPHNSQVGVDSPDELWILSPSPGSFSVNLAGFLPYSGLVLDIENLRRWAGRGPRSPATLRTSGRSRASPSGLETWRICIGGHFAPP